MNKPMTNNEMKDWEAKTWDRCQKQAWSEAMNREEIIRMAREAGFVNVRGGLKDNGELSDYWDCWPGQLEHFAALVATAEREACAKVCDDWPNGRDDVYSIGVAIRARGEK